VCVVVTLVQRVITRWGMLIGKEEKRGVNFYPPRGEKF
jgi:hypothetical protein